MCSCISYKASVVSQEAQRRQHTADTNSCQGQIRDKLGQSEGFVIQYQGYHMELLRNWSGTSNTQKPSTGHLGFLVFFLFCGQLVCERSNHEQDMIAACFLTTMLVHNVFVKRTTTKQVIGEYLHISMPSKMIGKAIAVTPGDWIHHYLLVTATTTVCIRISTSLFPILVLVN